MTIVGPPPVKPEPAAGPHGPQAGHRPHHRHRNGRPDQRPARTDRDRAEVVPAVLRAHPEPGFPVRTGGWLAGQRAAVTAEFREPDRRARRPRGRPVTAIDHDGSGLDVLPRQHRLEFRTRHGYGPEITGHVQRRFRGGPPADPRRDPALTGAADVNGANPVVVVHTRSRLSVMETRQRCRYRAHVRGGQLR